MSTKGRNYKDKSEVIQKGRILYVEPNDVNGYFKDTEAPMTPDYSDMCISFNLEVEVISRYKQEDGGTNGNNTYNIFWLSSRRIDEKTGKEEGYKPNYVSLMSGKAYNKRDGYDGDQFLTTYYTDTSYNDIVREQIVEGLGVEQVTIAFENYYTPTVTIKFVDVRGASLFGREEATHYEDKLTIDNIFGAFFTAPYPKFKLQVKGFFGKAVTLQLTCSGFKGQLNPQTGNFEATATFIGYSYSLLTDVPFQYLVAAPYCKYEGESYWEQKVNAQEFVLEDEGHKPIPKLFDFYKSVNAAFLNRELLESNKSDNDAIKICETEKSSLENIKSGVLRIFKKIIDKNNNYTYYKHYSENGLTEEGYQECMVLFTNDSTINLKPLKLSIDSFYGSINEYKELSGGNLIDFSKSLPFENYSSNAITENMPCLEVFNEISGGKYITKDFTGGNITSEAQKLSEKTNGLLTEKTAADLIQWRDNGHSVKKYIYIINFGELRQRAGSRIKELDTKLNSAQQNIERRYVELAHSNLGMVPYLGNIFHMVMAHLETLVYMMYKCFEHIHEQDRSFETLGISDSGITDMVSSDAHGRVPAWPMVSRTGNRTGNAEEDGSAIGWVGDFSQNFEEIKLVRELFLATRRTSKESVEEEARSNIKFEFLPVTAFDVNGNVNPFAVDREEKNLFSQLSGALGIRAAQLFGVCGFNKLSDDEVDAVGRMDSYNYYRCVGGKNVVEKLLTSVDGDFVNKILGCAQCSPETDTLGTIVDVSNNKRQVFEKIKMKDKRHSILIRNGNNFIYDYYTTKDKKGIIPSVINSFTSMSKNIKLFESGNNNTSYVDFEGRLEYKTLRNVIHTSPSKKFIESDLRTKNESVTQQEIDETYNSYINEELFRIETSPRVIGGITDRYTEMAGGSFKISDNNFTADFSKLLNKTWKVKTEDFDNFYKNVAINILNVPLIKRFSDKKEFLFLDDQDPEIITKDNKSDVKIEETLKLKYKEDLFSVDGKNETYQLSDLVVSEIPTLNGKQSLFMDENYYAIEEDVDRAILFILSVSKDFSKEATIKNVIIDGIMKNKMSQIQVIPYIYVLRVGVLLYLIKEGKIKDKEYLPNDIKKELDEYKDVINNELDSNITNSFIKAFKLFVKDPISIDKNIVDWQEIKRYCELFNNNGNQSMYGIKKIKEEIKKKYEQDLKYNKTDTSSISNNQGGNQQSTELEKVMNNSKLDILNNYLKSADIIKFHQKYSYIKVDTTGYNNHRIYFNEDSANGKKLQTILKTLLFSKTIILSTPDLSNRNIQQNEKGDAIIDGNKLTRYLTEFYNTLKQITSGDAEGSSDAQKNDENADSKDDDVKEFTRDVALPIYMYLKMLWDKWLINTASTWENNEYRVDKFFENFVFIDSFYRNIKHRFMVNCQTFLEVYDGNMFSNSDMSLFKFLGDITTKHHCMFLAVPDFIDGMGDENNIHAVNTMRSVFTPMPFSKLPPTENTNKFVVIYVPKFSETPSALNGFAEDGFNIMSQQDAVSMDDPSITRTGVAYHNNGTPLEPVFEKVYNDDGITRYGYFVPSFGLAYGRQNNHLFKSVNLNMETPIITSSVINTLAHITMKGAGQEHRIAYLGQDIYPVFSNYSYICEFEMMGDMQIQPLMYFQLMNVPMWRGTYMIFNVTHVMTPGNMVTKVRAMKLSNRGVPYSKAWFTKNFNFDPLAGKWWLKCFDGLGSENTGGSQQGTTSSGPETNTNTNKYFEHVGELVTRDNITKYLAINKQIANNKDRFVLHCTGSSGEGETATSIDKIHRSERGWKGIGYNFVIYRDGTVHMGRSINNPTQAHSGSTRTSNGRSGTSWNWNGIGIVYCGGTVDGRNVDNRTEPQRRAFRDLMQWILDSRVFKNLRHVYGHYDNGCGKACPCFNANAEYKIENGTVIMTNERQEKPNN